MDLQAPLHLVSAAVRSIICFILPAVMTPGNPRSPRARPGFPQKILTLNKLVTYQHTSPLQEIAPSQDVAAEPSKDGGGSKKKVPKSEANADGEPSQRQPKRAKKGKEVEACEKGPAEDKGAAQASQVVKKELQR